MWGSVRRPSGGGQKPPVWCPGQDGRCRVSGSRLAGRSRFLGAGALGCPSPVSAVALAWSGRRRERAEGGWAWARTGRLARVLCEAVVAGAVVSVPSLPRRGDGDMGHRTVVSAVTGRGFIFLLQE